jgi:glycerophosphoryl diester phosphodiesterase
MPGRPIVIAHRGASGYLPEHTLPAKTLAYGLGADFLEQDLVLTKDDVPIVLHDINLDTVTDVAKRFPDRKRADGRYYALDFTLAEIKTLRAVERIPALRPQNTAYDGEFEIPTLAEIVALVRAVEARSGRRVGIYPETKHPSHFQHDGRRLGGEPIGIDLSQRLVEELVSLRFTDPSRVFIQSFESANLRALATQFLPAAQLSIPLIQLIDATGAPRDFTLSGDPRGYADLITPEGLGFIGQYASGIGVPKRLVMPDSSIIATRLVADAHAAGLDVHVWTFRPENHFLPPRYRHGDAPDAHGALAAEIEAHLAAGIDGLFTDSPDLGRTAIRARFAATPG